MSTRSSKKAKTAAGPPTPSSASSVRSRTIEAPVRVSPRANKGLHRLTKDDKQASTTAATEPVRALAQAQPRKRDISKMSPTPETATSAGSDSRAQSNRNNLQTVSDADEEQLIHIPPKSSPAKRQRFTSPSLMAEPEFNVNEEDHVTEQMVEVEGEALVPSSITLFDDDDDESDGGSRQSQPLFTALDGDTEVHLFGEWPLFISQPVDLSDACHLLLNPETIPPERVCTSLPRGFRGDGTFVVHVQPRQNVSDVLQLVDDGLGTWSRPHIRWRFYRYAEDNQLIRCPHKRGTPQLNANDYDIKIQVRRHAHPESESRFIKKIHSLHSNDGALASQMFVITYTWIGEAFDFPTSDDLQVSVDDETANKPQSSQSVVERRHANGAVILEHNGCPLFAQTVIDFSEASRIILGARQINEAKVCHSVPKRFQDRGTFIIDIRKIDKDQLGRDGNGLWDKPAGNSRYYKIDEASGDAYRVDRSNKLQSGSADYDIQILSKRYEHPRAKHEFVRKIYTGRPQFAQPMEFCCNLAVITYDWKNEPFEFECETYSERPKGRPRRDVIHNVTYRIEPMPDLQADEPSSTTAADVMMARSLSPVDVATSSSPPPRLAQQPSTAQRKPKPTRKQSQHSNAASTAAPIMSSSSVGLGSNQQLQAIKREVLEREYENQERLAQLLDRAESFLDRLEAQEVQFVSAGGSNVVPYANGWTTVTEDTEEPQEYVLSGPTQFHPDVVA